ncbi:hypothetical protein [Parasediminibacterium sp. JCM 36343]|uniref:hypothetical protein n=1 Tax=Parasediminibacterium sp. JCM 36343 TaxID=3374279 RepID=UPI00397A0049
MVEKNVNLTSFVSIRTSLLTTVQRKIIASKVLDINELINAKLKVELSTISEILLSIETKFRKCEMIYFAYIENVGHDILSGNPSSLPYKMDCTFTDITTTFKYIYKCDDKIFYKEITDMNFQNFILTIASIYENIVALSEVILKKIIIHTKEKPPISTPLNDYLNYLKLLISLGYRGNDKLYQCLNKYESYFKSHLLIINQLRNRFIHGYSMNLSSDGFTYKVKIPGSTFFPPSAPQLDIDFFTLTVLDNTRNFIQDLYPMLQNSIKHHKKFIPG